MNHIRGPYYDLRYTVNPIKLETGLRPNSAGIPYTLLLRIEAIGFPTLGLLLYSLIKRYWALCVTGSYRAEGWGAFRNSVLVSYLHKKCKGSVVDK